MRISKIINKILNKKEVISGKIKVTDLITKYKQCNKSRIECWENKLLLYDDDKTSIENRIEMLKLDLKSLRKNISQVKKVIKDLHITDKQYNQYVYNENDIKEIRFTKIYLENKLLKTTEQNIHINPGDKVYVAGEEYEAVTSRINNRDIQIVKIIKIKK